MLDILLRDWFKNMKRIQVEVQGQVQGVGFRPHVYRLATELAFTGWVKNNASGVHIEIQGTAVHDFLHRLQAECPPLAQIDHIYHSNIPLKADETQFTIEKSESGSVTTKISPDATVCEACLSELFDPESRYYRYPFINCTHCGPRYTITHHLPYDRASTSMAQFTMCDPCLCAYENPLDRRYHAQPVACHACGPKLSHGITDIVHAIRDGKIVALKGLGGYQLICDAKNIDAIKRLRKNKERSYKPFALMVLNSKSAVQYVHCSIDAETILTSRERPIVILPKKEQSLRENIAPYLNALGIMLPYTPIHYLLFNALLGSPNGNVWLNERNDIVLVVTSANPSGCPLIKEDAEALEKLSSLADVIVSYNRDIVIRVDDSVVSVMDSKPFFIRRARSYIPKAIPLPYEIPTTLAFGGYLKNTVCVTRGKEAFVSQHIGDLSNRETIRFYRETIEHLLQILDVKPECVAHDWHSDFYSTQIAAEFNVPVFPIQHHHAHLAAVAAEHGISGDAIGLALDGFGLGENKESWGGELMHYQGSTYERLGSFRPLMQPGGDSVVRQPWRMAASVLFELNEIDEIKKRFGQYTQSKSIVELLDKRINAPLTSSCGRLFDAASALLGICEISSYEGEAAMRLESKVSEMVFSDSMWTIHSNQLNLLPLFKALLDCDPISGANLFHGTLASALVEWIRINAEKQAVKQVLMSGGCFLNRVLSEWIINQLTELQLIPLYPRQCPPNDGGISLGQAWIAGNKLLEKN